MNKKIKPFQFKKFSVEHDKCAMKVGFDGALLAVWAHHKNPLEILDIGSGSGLISLILRQRFEHANILAIEPNKNAFIQSKINFKNSPFEKKINLLLTNLQSFSCEHKFDLILSNPPFFSEDTDSSDKDRNEARQEKYLPLIQLLGNVKKLLNKEGKFFLIYPTWEASRVFLEASNLNLHICTITKIFSKKQKPSKRTIFEFQLESCNSIHKEFVSGNQDVGYSKPYSELMKEFYTIF
ncbi:MAG: hypothetical protein CMP63_07635 [Flavobacteriales bacterium]|nr:hypothetical protein [Flavobacteriales bacterium]|tara:strand:- start:6759 stop:7472 length:714 start_codon:yes stop_codon:yes gene_type:complete